MKYYIASRLENHANVKLLKKYLDEAGWEHTYDWTVHGSVRDVSTTRMAEVARNEVEGVANADVVIVILPGGRGTHIEMGIALHPSSRSLLWVVSNQPEKDFGLGEDTCAFYHHPRAFRINGPAPMSETARSILRTRSPCLKCGAPDPSTCDPYCGVSAK